MYTVCSHVVGYCAKNWEDHYHSSCWGFKKGGNEDSGYSIYMLMRMGVAFLKRGKFKAQASSLNSQDVSDECCQSKHVNSLFRLRLRIPIVSKWSNVKPHPFVLKTPMVAIYEIYFHCDSQQHSR